MRIEICETNYSESPVGDNTWDIHITTYGQTQIIPENKSASEALNYLLSIYPSQELQIDIVPLQAKELVDVANN